ncbi:lyase family protein, partial [candidate division KSB1 bacterium]
KVHTARSRNDQVLTALRLLYRDELQHCAELISGLNGAVKVLLGKYGRIKIPGYTHMRKAMPSSVSLWGRALIDSMRDNQRVIVRTADLVDQSPLGSGAGYGIPLKVDRGFTAKELGFRKIQHNPLYVQNSRGKFEAEILHTLSQIMYDLNRTASDLILFSMPEFGYFELPDELCTGSSIMPQKKNPDVLEILRARYHQVVSYEFQVKQISGNLISGYNRDLQLTKAPVIRGFDITKQSLQVAALLFECLKVNNARCAEALTEELYATEEVYSLVRQGIPFRDAYKRIAEKY